MPKGYEKMRDKFISEGMTKKNAQKKAARIWNSNHKTKVSRKEHTTKRKNKQRAAEKLAALYL